MEKIKICHLFFLISISVGVQAQSILSGSVKDTSGDALIGASVFFKNTSIGTTTDLDGRFKLQPDDNIKNAALVISYIGYLTQELAIGNRTNFDVVLADDATILEGIVITGYTSEVKGKIIGAVNTISQDLISKLPVSGIDQALQGRAPGVVVTQNTGAPGEGVSVRIRGSGSINSGNNPLYIVDGVPTLDIGSISTQDIESITVLKDAGATALYGSRAANGVVIVTTKSGSSDKQTITLSSQVGVQSASRLIKMTNTNDYVSIFNEAANNDNANKNPLLYRPLITEDIRATLLNVDQVQAILRDGILQTHSLSISGGNEKTKYFVSGNYFNQQGIIKSSDYDRLSSRINISSEVKPWFSAGVNLNISRATTNAIGSSGDGAGGNGGSVIRYAFFRTPAIPIYDANGDFTDKPDRFDLFGDGYNPVGMLAYNNNEHISNRMFGKFFVELRPLENLKFTSNFGVDFNSANQRRFDRNWGSGNRINNPNQLGITDGRFQTITFSNFATYNKSFNQNSLTFLLGTEAIKSQGYEVFASEKSFPDQESNLVFLGNGLGQRVANENKFGNALLSFFGKLNYDYNEKYLVSATIRRDGSSRFGTSNRWGTFYSGSLGWRLDKEAFFADSKLIDLMMLRVGYGAIGNQEIGNYASTDIINSGFDYPFGNTRQTGFAVSNLGNSNLKWETSKQFNAGVDIEIVGGKVSTSIDYFNKITSDLLIRQPIASSAGNAQAPWINNGEVSNKGVELALTYNNSIHDFHYSISGNVATLTNKVLKVDAPIVGGAIGSDRITKTEEGYPIGSFFLYEMEGIFQSTTQIFTHAFQGNGILPGDVMFKDQDANGVINGNDRTHTGSPIPKITAGLNVNLNYQNWDMTIFFQGAYGQKIFSVLNRDIEGFYRPFTVTQRYFDNHWTGPGTSNQYPRASWDASGNNTRYSTRFLDDGSYTRLKNLQVGYTIPKDIMNRYGFSSFRIYFSAANLLTFTKYHGLDPEMTVSDNAKGQGDVSAGLDWGTYPTAKSYNVGVNLTF